MKYSEAVSGTMKSSYWLMLFGILLLVAGACNQHTEQDKALPDSLQPDPATAQAEEGGESLSRVQSDSALVHLSFKILNAVREKDFEGLSQFIHPALGVRFSPYGHIDTARGKLFSKEQFLAAAKENKPVTWGLADGTGEPIRLTMKEYFDRFVYDADYLHPEKRAVNARLSSGNTLDNTASVYPGNQFTEFHFSGFDPKYEGMDWKNLRLVFMKAGSENFLVAIIHDQWTV